MPASCVLICPDKFRGCLPAGEVASALAAGVRVACPESTVDCCPLADGGEGFLEALAAEARGAQRRWVRVSDPIREGRVRSVEVGVLADGTVVIESARLCGLDLIPQAARNPGQISTRPLGECLREVAGWRPRSIWVGLGGSATVDGGLGLAAALGWRFLDAEGNELNPVGDQLNRIRRVVAPSDPFPVPVVGAVDVRSPLTGAMGAAPMFGPQKGASAEQVEALDRGLGHLANQRAAWQSLALKPGAGAAGGLGFGLMAFAGATLSPGFDLVARALRWRERLRMADWVLTGEGCVDRSSRRGKVTGRVVAAARRRGLPVSVVGGRVLHPVGPVPHLSLLDLAGSEQASMGAAEAWLKSAGEFLGRQWMSAPRDRPRH